VRLALIENTDSHECFVKFVNRARHLARSMLNHQLSCVGHNIGKLVERKFDRECISYTAIAIKNVNA
jgi:hypothetical protein